MMKTSRIFVVMLAIALTALSVSCGNPLEGGSEPSGSVLRVTDVQSSGLQDIFFCEGSEVEYASMTFTITNESRPNFEDSPTSPEGTNSFVTLNRYIIDYTPINMSGQIPSTEGAFTGGIPPNGEAEIGLPIITEPVLEYIRGHFPSVGNGQAMDLRIDLTYWGKDAFDVNVNVVVSTSVTVDDFAPCPTDLPPPDESE